MSKIVQFKPKDWTKKGEIFSDEQSRYVFVCAICLKNLEEYHLGFFAYDVNSFWTHINSCHQESKSKSSKADLNQNVIREPPEKNCESQDVIVICEDSDDDDNDIKYKKLYLNQCDSEQNRSSETREDLKSRNLCYNGELLSKDTPQNFTSEKFQFNPKQNGSDVNLEKTKNSTGSFQIISNMIINENKTDLKDFENENSIEQSVTTSNNDDSEIEDLFFMDDECSIAEHNELEDYIKETVENQDEHTRMAASPSNRNTNSTDVRYKCIFSECNNSMEYIKHFEIHKNAVLPGTAADSTISDNSSSMSVSSTKNSTDLPTSTVLDTVHLFKNNQGWQIKYPTEKKLKNIKVSKRPFKCVACNRTTCTQKAMSTHMQRYHTKDFVDESTKCPKCHKWILKKNVQKHNAMHLRLYCRLCQRSFKNNDLLNKHMLNDHKCTLNQTMHAMLSMPSPEYRKQDPNGLSEQQVYQQKQTPMFNPFTGYQSNIHDFPVNSFQPRYSTPSAYCPTVPPLINNPPNLHSTSNQLTLPYLYEQFQPPS